MNTKKTDVLTKAKSYFLSYFGNEQTESTQTKTSLTVILKTAAKDILISAVSYLLSKTTLFFGSMPLGTAYLCAKKTDVFFAYIGLAVSCATDSSPLALPSFLIYTALWLGRILVWRTHKTKDEKAVLYGEKLLIRQVESISALLLLSAYKVAYYGFLYYDIFGSIVSVAVCPIAILIMNIAVSEKEKFTPKGEAARLACLFTLCLSLKTAVISGFSLGIMTSIFLTYYVAKNGGMMRGGIYGLVMGMAVSPALSPVIGLCGIISGISNGAKAVLGTALSCVVGVVGSVYTGGWDSLRVFVPELLCSSMIYLPLCQYGLLPDGLITYSEQTVSKTAISEKGYLAEKWRNDTEKRFNMLSDAFSEMSDVFYTLSDRMRRPGLIDVKEICDSVCDEYCLDCAFKRVCWEKEYTSTQDVFTKVAKELTENGYATKNGTDPFFADRCRSYGQILERINTEHAKLLEKRIKQSKTEVFAMDYGSMSNLLKGAFEEKNAEYSPDTEKSFLLAEALRKMGIDARNVCVFGERCIYAAAFGVSPFKISKSADDIKRVFENICGVRMTSPEFEMGEEEVTMKLKAVRKYKVEYHALSGAKNGEQMCGDTVCMFETESDSFYSIINDGMGSGREAALTSRLCSMFLKKMLSAGNSKPVSLEMLNNFIRSKNTECFSTVDLFEIDLISGKAEFIKSGAASSYIKRGDRLFRVSSNTMPVGITQEINAEKVRLDLQGGDVVIMVSDGVGQTDADAAKLSELLTFDYTDDIVKMTERIFELSGKLCRKNDDISVGVIRISECA